jgi:hypothetical protein
MSSNGATAVGIQRLSNLTKRLEVRMTTVVSSTVIRISLIVGIYIAHWCESHCCSLIWLFAPYGLWLLWMTVCKSKCLFEPHNGWIQEVLAADQSLFLKPVDMRSCNSCIVWIPSYGIKVGLLLLNLIHSDKKKIHRSNGHMLSFQIKSNCIYHMGRIVKCLLTSLEPTKQF